MPPSLLRSLAHQDTLKSKEKCIKHAAAALRAGRSVVVDNTNPSADTRKAYISVAVEVKAAVRCFVFTTPAAVCQHLNAFREKQTAGAHKRVPRIAFNQYKGRLVVPRKEEGIDEIVHVPFVPTFASEHDRKLFQELS